MGVADAAKAVADTKVMKIILPRPAKPLLFIQMVVAMLKLTPEPVYLMMFLKLPEPQPQLTALNSIMA